MKKLPLLLGSLMVVFGAGALAQSACTCSGPGATQVTDNGNNQALTNTLSGNTVCVPKTGGGWEAQEQHRVGGELWDFKQGASSRVDPTSKVGTWAVSGNGAGSAVKHTYGTQPYDYKVCRVGTSNAYGFCPSGGPTIMSTIKSGLSSCP